MGKGVFMSFFSHKMNYSSVWNKRNKRSPLLFFFKKIFQLPSLLLLLEHPLYTHTNSRTHHLLIFHIFPRKIRKMRFKFSNEVHKQWLFFLYALTFIVFSQYTCSFFVNLHHLNQIKQITPPVLLILICSIFQSMLLLRPSVIQDQRKGV